MNKIKWVDAETIDPQKRNPMLVRSFSFCSRNYPARAENVQVRDASEAVHDANRKILPAFSWKKKKTYEVDLFCGLNFSQYEFLKHRSLQSTSGSGGFNWWVASVMESSAQLPFDWERELLAAPIKGGQ